MIQQKRLERSDSSCLCLVPPSLGSVDESGHKTNNFILAGDHDVDDSDGNHDDDDDDDDSDNDDNAGDDDDDDDDDAGDADNDADSDDDDDDDDNDDCDDKTGALFYVHAFYHLIYPCPLGQDCTIQVYSGFNLGTLIMILMMNYQLSL